MEIDKRTITTQPLNTRAGGKGKENIWNLPNALTFSRILITFLLAYFIFAGLHIIYIISIFVIGMFSDFLDGFIAKRFNLKTEFGRKFDMIADRFLIIGFFLAIVIKFSVLGILTKSHLFQLIFISARDLITVPIGLFIMILKEKAFPQVKFVGKATTFSQTLTFPLILLSVFYPFFNFSIFFALATGTLGIISSFYYIYDVRKMMIDKKS